jgi:hypothetical protein
MATTVQAATAVVAGVVTIGILAQTLKRKDSKQSTKTKESAEFSCQTKPLTASVASGPTSSPPVSLLSPSTHAPSHADIKVSCPSQQIDGYNASAPAVHCINALMFR